MYKVKSEFRIYIIQLFIITSDHFVFLKRNDISNSYISGKVIDSGVMFNLK